MAQRTKKYKDTLLNHQTVIIVVQMNIFCKKNFKIQSPEGGCKHGLCCEFR